MRVFNFVYNGFFGRNTGGYAEYTAEFVEWTKDPGITKCKCSDGEERLIPSFALENFDCASVPKQEYENAMCVFGTPCRS